MHHIILLWWTLEPSLIKIKWRIWNLWSWNELCLRSYTNYYTHSHPSISQIFLFRYLYCKWNNKQQGQIQKVLSGGIPKFVDIFLLLKSSYFTERRGGLYQYSKGAIIGMPAKCHFNCVSLVGWWWHPVIEWFSGGRGAGEGGGGGGGSVHEQCHSRSWSECF